MPTLFGHALLPIAAGAGLGRTRISGRLVAWCVFASMLPDLDVLGFKFGIAYGDAWGHRGATHSIGFALLVGMLSLALARPLNASRSTAWMAGTLACLSHGILDMFTNGGLGVALAWPLSNQRFFFPWRIIEVSPIGARFFSERALPVLLSEVLYVGIPCVILGLILAYLSGRFRRN